MKGVTLLELLIGLLLLLVSLAVVSKWAFSSVYSLHHATEGVREEEKLRRVLGEFQARLRGARSFNFFPTVEVRAGSVALLDLAEDRLFFVPPMTSRETHRLPLCSEANDSSGAYFIGVGVDGWSLFEGSIRKEKAPCDFSGEFQLSEHSSILGDFELAVDRLLLLIPVNSFGELTWGKDLRWRSYLSSEVQPIAYNVNIKLQKEEPGVLALEINEERFLLSYSLPRGSHLDVIL